MGSVGQVQSSNMKAFFCIALVSAASAAPQLLAGHLGHVGVVAGGQRSHQSVSKPFQGEVRTTSQAKSFGSPIASVASSDSVSNTAQSGLASHLGQGAVLGGVAHGVVGHGLAHGVVGHGFAGHGLAHGVVGHGLAHGVVGHGIAHPVAHAIARPVVHAAPAYHAPLRAIAHPVAHAVAEVYPDEVSPYQFQYAVADDYSGSNFQASETDDGTAARTGSYSVALPDGRTQHVSYTANDIDGYVATVTYDGQAAYPQAVAVAHPVAHAIARPVVYAAPVYRGAGQVSHQSVSKPYQGEHRATTQSKAFGATVAAVHDSPSRLNGAHSRNGLALVGHGALIG